MASAVEKFSLFLLCKRATDVNLRLRARYCIEASMQRNQGILWGITAMLFCFVDLATAQRQLVFANQGPGFSVPFRDSYPIGWTSQALTRTSFI